MIDKPPDNDYILLMDRNRILRTIDRMAYQIDEKLQGAGTMLVVGVKERGAAVAKSLTNILEELTNSTIFKLHVPENATEAEKVHQAEEFPNHFDYALIVDDVIFSGQTMLSSIEIVRRDFEFDLLQTAVLVDRGHRTVPVDASYSGINLPTKLNEHVQVCLNENSPEKVVLTKASG